MLISGRDLFWYQKLLGVLARITYFWLLEPSEIVFSQWLCHVLLVCLWGKHLVILYLFFHLWNEYCNISLAFFFCKLLCIWKSAVGIRRVFQNKSLKNPDKKVQSWFAWDCCVEQIWLGPKAFRHQIPENLVKGVSRHPCY